MACAAAQVKERGVGLRLEPRARRATSREPAPHDAKCGPRVTRFYTALNDGIRDAPVSQPYAYRAPGRDQGTAHEIQLGVESRSWSRRRRRIQRRSRAAFAAGFATVGVNAVGSSSAASAAACCCAALLSQVLELDEHGGTAAISVVLAKQRRWPRHLAIGVLPFARIGSAGKRVGG